MNNRSTILYIQASSQSQQEQNSEAINPTPKIFHRVGHHSLHKNFFYNQEQTQYFHQQTSRNNEQSKIEAVKLENNIFEYKDNHPEQVEAKLNSSMLLHYQSQCQQQFEANLEIKANLFNVQFEDSDDNEENCEELKNQKPQNNNEDEKIKPNQQNIQEISSKTSNSESSTDIVLFSGKEENFCHYSSLSDQKAKASFLSQPIVRNIFLEATLVRSNPLDNLLYTKFDVCFEKTNSHLISARKIIGNMGAKYLIFCSAGGFSASNKCIGKWRTTNNDEIYNFYSEGLKPEEIRGNLQNSSKRRSILATIKLTKGSVRNMEVYLLKNGANYFDLLNFKSEEPNLHEIYKKKTHADKILYFESKRPISQQQSPQYYSNLKGKAKICSTKNFILEDPVTRKQILIFAKQAQNTYYISMGYPLSPRLALAIIITVFQSS